MATLPTGPNPLPVAEKFLYRIRLKDKHDVREVVVSAKTLDQASKVGQAYCDREKYRFIRAEPMVVAGEEILSQPNPVH